MATTDLSFYDKNDIDGSGLTIGITVSKWNDDVTSGLLEGAVSILKKHNTKTIKIIEVPGSFELIYASKLLQNNCDAVIALGSVIQGETKHFDFVCNAVSMGIKDLNCIANIEGDLIPVIFGVLTDNTKQQALDRSGGKLGNKGIECAVAAIKMAKLQITTHN